MQNNDRLKSLAERFLELKSEWDSAFKTTLAQIETTQQQSRHLDYLQAQMLEIGTQMSVLLVPENVPKPKIAEAAVWLAAAAKEKEKHGLGYVFWCGTDHPDCPPGAAAGVNPPDPSDWPDGGALVDPAGLVFTVVSGEWICINN